MLPFVAGFCAGVYIGTKYDCEVYIEKVETFLQQLPKKK